MDKTKSFSMLLSLFWLGSMFILGFGGLTNSPEYMKTGAVWLATSSIIGLMIDREKGVMGNIVFGIIGLAIAHNIVI